MDKAHDVEWTERSLSNALAIKVYLKRKFSTREVLKFEKLLQGFEKTVSSFPTLYPLSKKQKPLRRAVIHKNTTVYYIFEGDKVTVVAMKDNRQKEPEN